MTFYNLTMDDLCDLMCGCPDHDESEIAGSEQEADNGNYNQPCK